MIPVHLLTCSLPVCTMMKKVYVYSCLLFALSFVEMKPINITGHVGETLTIKCSDWNSWTDVRHNVKYFCNSPCSEDKHVIIKAEFGKTKTKNGIEVINLADGFYVTFTNLQMSDSKTYHCGAERVGYDSFIEVNLKVINAESYSPKTTPKTVTVHPTFSFAVTDDVMSSYSSDIITDIPTSHPTLNTTLPTGSARQGAAESYSPKTTPKTVTVQPTLSFAVTDDSVMSSNSWDIITDIPTSHTTLNTTLPTGSARQGAGNVLYLTAGVISIITIVMVVLILALKRMKKQQAAVTTPQEDTVENAVPDQVYQSLHQITMDEDKGYSTLTPSQKEKNSTQLCHSVD